LAADEQLGIPFQEILVPFNEPGYPAFTAFPRPPSPVLHDGATRIWDSLSIAEYLAEKHPGVWPPMRPRARGLVPRGRDAQWFSRPCATRVG